MNGLRNIQFGRQRQWKVFCLSQSVISTNLVYMAPIRNSKENYSQFGNLKIKVCIFFSIQLNYCSLWISPREDNQQPVQRLKVLNLIPKVKITGRNHQLFIEQKQENKSFSSLEIPTFESIDEIVPHLNKLLISNRYFGNINFRLLANHAFI